MSRVTKTFHIAHRKVAIVDHMQGGGMLSMTIGALGEPGILYLEDVDIVRLREICDEALLAGRTNTEKQG